MRDGACPSCGLTEAQILKAQFVAMLLAFGGIALVIMVLNWMFG
jgi:hypothetical protein